MGSWPYWGEIIPGSKTNFGLTLVKPRSTFPKVLLVPSNVTMGQNKVLRHLKDCNKMGSQQHKTCNVWPKIQKRDCPGGPVVRTSPVAQWWGPHLPMQGVRAQSWWGSYKGFFLMLHIKKKKENKIQRSRRIWFTTIVIVQLLSHVRLFEAPRTAAHQASLSFTVSRSLLKFMSLKKINYSHRPGNDKEDEMTDKGCQVASTWSIHSRN